MTPDPRKLDGHLGPRVHWEKWSLNGEVCIAGLVPTFDGGTGLADSLTWLLRGFASHCRRTYDATGVLAFEFTGGKTPDTLARVLSLHFDLALQDTKLIREHVRRRGGDPATQVWPAFWLEGDVHAYIPSGVPLPRDRAPRRKVVVLAEEWQTFIPARYVGLGDRTTRRWTDDLDALASLDASAVSRLLHEDQHGFLTNMLVLVHAQPSGKPRARPTLEESYRRHESLVAELAPLAEEKGLPVRWHALWRLPSGMTWRGPDDEPWMRYPAVSFAIAVRPLRTTG